MPGKPDFNHEANRRALADIRGLIDKGRRARLLAKLRPQRAPKPAEAPPDEDELMLKVAALKEG